MSHTIIMIHGFRGTHHGLALIAGELRPDYTCIVPDIPGFGDGPTLASYTLDAYVEWLHDFIADQQLETPPVLLGHSFGSIITAAYAARYPHTIDRLVLVNPIGAPALEGPRGTLTKLAVAYYWLGRVLPARLAHAWLAAKPIVFIMSTTMAKTRDKTTRRWIHQQHYTYFSTYHSADSVSQAFRTSVSHSVRDVAEHITTPTLLVAGDIDDITPLARQHELAERIADSQLAVISGVGHLTHYETPAEVAGAIREFLDAAPATSPAHPPST